MLYSTLGRTGLKVSRLGFGTLRLPMTLQGDKEIVDRSLAIPLMHRAFEAGVNYVDTGVMYCNFDAQSAVGDALHAWRESERARCATARAASGGDAAPEERHIIVATKNHYNGEDEKEWWTHLENSLQRLGVPALDIYNHHGIDWKCYVNNIEPRTGKWMQKAKDQGLIKRICVSFHDGNEAMRKMVDTGYAETITVPYNLLSRGLEDGIAYAHEKGMGVLVMNPAGGGRLGGESPALLEALPEVRRVPELALRFVLANPNVSVVLSGMGTMQHVEENVAIASDGRTLTAEEIEFVERHLERLKAIGGLTCTGCDYCRPCPQGVFISHIFTVLNDARAYGLWDSARALYAGYGHGNRKNARRADACNECGACEKKCPQKLPIRQLLKEAHEALRPKD